MSTAEQNKTQTDISSAIALSTISDTKQDEPQPKEQGNIEQKLEDEPLKVLLNEHQQYYPDEKSQKTENKLLAEGQDISWRYNMTLGDLVKYKVPSLKDSNRDVEYWFSMTPEHKKRVGSKDPNRLEKRVFVSGNIKRLSDIDAVEQTFRAEFYLYLNWYLTKEEYLDYLQFQQDHHDGNTEGWEPKQFPCLEVPNCVDKNEFGYEKYPKQGRFRVVNLHQFGSHHLDLKDGFDDIGRNGVFCRAKWNVSGVFSEELELQDFPFDVQPLCIQILSRRQKGMEPIFLPDFRKRHFFKMDPVYSVYPEWELVGLCADFGDATIAASRSKASYSKIEVRMILKRKWAIYVFRSFMVIAVIDMLGLCAFVIYDTTDRLNMLLALLLTIVIAMQETLNESYLTLLSKYSLAGFLYLVLLTTQATFYEYYEQETDTIFLYLFVAIFVVIQLCFCYVAIAARKRGLKFAHFSADELEKERGMSKIGYLLNYLSPYRYGDGNRLLGFNCEPLMSMLLEDKHRIKVKNNSVNVNQMWSIGR